MNSDPFIDKNGTFDSLATALANMVLPHPGGPNKIAPCKEKKLDSTYISISLIDCWTYNVKKNYKILKRNKQTKSDTY